MTWHPWRPDRRVQRFDAIVQAAMDEHAVALAMAPRKATPRFTAHDEDGWTILEEDGVDHQTARWHGFAGPIEFDPPEPTPDWRALAERFRTRNP